MPISIQGNWTLTCIYKQGPALPQRFIISGATQGNGTYPGVEGSSISVIGNNWQVNIQANDNYESNGPWYDSDLVKTSTQAVGNQYIFQINSEDFLQDGIIDLILECSQPIPIQPPPAAPPPSIPVPEPPPVLPPSNPIPEIPPVLPPVAEITPGKVYTLIPEEDKLPRQRITITKGIWSEGSGSMNYFLRAHRRPHLLPTRSKSITSLVTLADQKNNSPLPTGTMGGLGRRTWEDMIGSLLQMQFTVSTDFFV